MRKLNRLKNWAKEYQLLTYYVVTLLISWGGLIIFLGGPEKLSSYATDVPFLPLYLVTVAGPSIAGILLIGIFDGKKGYSDFFSRLLKWRLQIKWYAAAILIAPASVFATLFVLSLFNLVFMPGIFSSGDNPVALSFGLSGSDKISFVSFVIMLGLFNGFIEELGWTGFATHKIRINHSIIAAGLNLGFMWGVWHLFANYIGSAADAGKIPLPIYLTVMLFSFLPPFRVIMTWVYKYTRSLFIAIIMHASLDVFWILSMPNILTGQQRVIWYIVWAVVLWGTVAVIGKSVNKRSLAE